MKKNILLSIISLVVVIQVSGQTVQGSLMIGGSLGFSSSSSETTVGGTTTDGPQYSSFNLMPYAGYFLSDNLAVGLGLGYSSSSVTTNDGDNDLTDKSSLIEVMPFARYYYVHGDMVHMYAQLGIGFGFGTYTDEYFDGTDVVSVESDMSTMNIGIGPGATVMLGEKCGLEIHYGSLGFTSYKTTDSTGDFEYKESGFGLSWAETFGFGIVFHL